MAVYFMYMKTFGRGNGSSAISAVAYRAGERIRDERTGKTFDHAGRQDVMHKEIVLPAKLADADMSWALERTTLWNAVEAAESRKNARVAREFLVALRHIQEGADPFTAAIEATNEIWLAVLAPISRCCKHLSVTIR